ncbi:MAG: hypothetical protein C4332_03355 [Meiothermus sp.]
MSITVYWSSVKGLKASTRLLVTDRHLQKGLDNASVQRFCGERIGELMVFHHPHRLTGAEP